MKTDDIKTALQDTLPVLAGYMVLGTGFGMIMNAAGYGFVPAFAMSAFIYAGSMQYAAVGLFADRAGLVTVALTTLIVNARHLFYGISMIDKYKNAGAKKPYMVFALTDETYSIVCICSGTDCKRNRGTQLCMEEKYSSQYHKRNGDIYDSGTVCILNNSFSILLL